MQTLSKIIYDGRDAEAFARKLQSHELEEKESEPAENRRPKDREADFGMHAVHEDDGKDLLKFDDRTGVIVAPFFTLGIFFLSVFLASSLAPLLLHF